MPGAARCRRPGRRAAADVPFTLVDRERLLDRRGRQRAGAAVLVPALHDQGPCLHRRAAGESAGRRSAVRCCSPSTCPSPAAVIATIVPACRSAGAASQRAASPGDDAPRLGLGRRHSRAGRTASAISSRCSARTAGSTIIRLDRRATSSHRIAWEDIAWVAPHWDGPLIIKGILDPEDAREAVASGADGIVVSNHGGRQLDGVLSTRPRLARDRRRGRRRAADPRRRRRPLRPRRGAHARARRGFVLLGRAWAYALAARGGEAASREC